MDAERTIAHIYDVAQWSYAEDEFNFKTYHKLHTVLLDSDLEINFMSISKDEFLVYVPIFHMSVNPQDDLEKIKHLSSAVLKLNFESSIGSAIVADTYRIELCINTAVMNNDQCVFLVQKFLENADFLIAESRTFADSQRGFFSNVPVDFLMS